MRQPGQPAAQQAVDLLWSHLLTNGLQPLGAFAGNESVVQRFEADPFPAKLAFGILVSVQTQLGIVRKVRGELEKERTELTVQTIPVILIHHCRGTNNPRVASACFRVAPLLRPEHRRLLLCLAEQDHTFGLVEAGQMLGHHIVLALALAELHHRALWYAPFRLRYDSGPSG